MLGTSLLWRSTVAFAYLKVKSAKCLCLLPVSWSWSCHFGLGLKNLVVFTSLVFRMGVKVKGDLSKSVRPFMRRWWFPIPRPSAEAAQPLQVRPGRCILQVFLMLNLRVFAGTKLHCLMTEGQRHRGVRNVRKSTAHAPRPESNPPHCGRKFHASRTPLVFSGYLSIRLVTGVNLVSHCDWQYNAKKIIFAILFTFYVSEMLFLLHFIVFISYRDMLLCQY